MNLKKRRFNIEPLLRLIFLTAMFWIIPDFNSSGQIELLINPKFKILIFISVLILFIFFAYQLPNIFSEMRNEGGKISGVKYFIFLMMTVLLIIARYFPSSESSFDNLTKTKSYVIEMTDPGEDDIESDDRNVTSNDDFSGNIKEFQKPVNEYETTAQSKDIIFDDVNFMTLVDAIYQNIEGFSGKPVSIKGFVYNMKDLDEDHFVISRLLMVCCAADATVVGFICEKDGSEHNFKENDWYEIKGVVKKDMFSLYRQNGEMPVIKITSYRKIEKLDNPYVYQNLQ